MKHYFLIFLILALFAACSTGTGEAISIQQLTPYITKTIVSDTPMVVETAEMAPTLAVTPTPVVHIVSLGDTISSIALQYGVSIDALLIANPEISPTAMIVGDTVVIPSEGLPDAAKLDASLAEVVRIERPYCTNTAGGLWCSAMIENISEMDMVFPVITFKFLDGAGNTISEKSTPAILQKLNAGSSLPAVLFIGEVPPQFNRAEASLFSAESAQGQEDTGVVVEQERNLQLDALSATISGTMRVVSEENEDRQDLSIAAAAMDIDRNIVGVRRKDISVEVNAEFDFNIAVFSTGNEIVDVILYTEVY